MPNLSDLNKSHRNIIHDELNEYEFVTSNDIIDEIDFNLEDSIIDRVDNIEEHLDEFKKAENTKYTTENGIKEFECKDGYVDNITIEGKTLVNLVNLSTLNIEHSNCRTFTLKANTVYTLFNFLNDEDGQTCILNEDLTTLIDWTPNKVYSFLNPIDQVVIPHYNFSNSFKIVVLEGYHTDKPIPYFEGLKSAGQDVNEISVLSINENLFDGQIRNGKYNYITGAFSVSDEIKANVNAIRVEPNTQYFINRIGIGNDILNRILYYDYSMNLISSETKGNTTFTTPNNCYYINFHIATHEVTSQNKIQISKGNQITNYTPHKQDKKRILYYNSDTKAWENPVLREWDTIEKHSDGKYYYHVRSGEITLNGSESWNYSTNVMVDSEDTVGFYIGLETKSHNSTNVLSSHFNSIIDGHMYSGNIEGINLFHCDNVRIRIKKSKLSTQNTTGFKTWLQANPVTVVYQLAEEKVYECTNFNPQTYSDSTILLLNSGVIQAEADFEVTNSIGSEIEVLKDKVSSLDKTVKHEHNGYQQWALTDNRGEVTNAGTSLDADILTTPGFFRANIATNIPTPGTYYIEVYRYNKDYIMQRATHISGKVDGIYIRIMKEGTWDSWQKISSISTSNIEAELLALQEENQALREELTQMQASLASLTSLVTTTLGE